MLVCNLFFPTCFDRVCQPAANSYSQRQHRLELVCRQGTRFLLLKSCFKVCTEMTKPEISRMKKRRALYKDAALSNIKMDCHLPWKTGILPTFGGGIRGAQLACQKVHLILSSSQDYVLFSNEDLRDFHRSFSMLFSGPSLSYDARYKASSLKTGAVRRYCRILRSLSKGHSTFFHVMKSITCLASSQNFSKLTSPFGSLLAHPSLRK